jgi:aspartate kinase
VPKADYEACMEILNELVTTLGARDVKGDKEIAIISIVGVGMRSHTGVANTMFKTLADNEINIQMISTSEIKVSVIIDESHLEKAVQTLHTAFDLDSV